MNDPSLPQSNGVTLIPWVWDFFSCLHRHLFVLLLAVASPIDGDLLCLLFLFA